MGTVSKLIPDTVRGMKHLDRDKFLRNIRIPVLKLSKDKLANVMPICKPYILKLDSFKPVQTLNDEQESLDRCMYLDPEKVMSWKDIAEDHRALLTKHDVREENFDTKDVQVTYDNFKYHHIFKAVLPEGMETVSGFSQIGHIIHLNLRDHLLEYKSLIGSVLLDKVKTCKTVVNKCNVIDNTYRNFSMELLAGEENYIVSVKENLCNFQFDFSKVYWNPRLCVEHERILKCVKPGDILFDIFCGVGPFAVPAAKKKCTVFANDLNPESYKWLNHNAKQNNVKPAFFNSYNLDGKEFICKNFKDFIKRCCVDSKLVNPGAKIHVTMNLPALAVEFLKYFNGLIDDKELQDHFNLNIIIYVYCFAVGEDPVETAKQMVIDNMSRDLTSEILDVCFVRNVSPKKEMMKVSLKLTKEILFGVDSELNEPPSKKKCVENEAVDMTQTNMDLVDISAVLEETEQVLLQCFKQFNLEEVFLSFNGGKDCTVLLDLTINILKQIYERDDICKDLKVVYIRTKNPFSEIEEFVEEIKEEYGVNLMVVEGEIKAALEGILEKDDKLKVCLMGTRRTDPYSENLSFMQKTDANWPQIVRVSPLLNWNYHHIWSYILQRRVAYCNLYDKGYTSIGSKYDTGPNPALASEGGYEPAWLLADASLERAGRGVAHTNGHDHTYNGDYDNTCALHIH